MTKKAFIFDLDGVIVDTAKFHYLAWKELANELGFDFTEEQNEDLKGVSRVASLEILLNIGKIKLSNERKEELLKEKNEQYLGYIAKMGQDDMAVVDEKLKVRGLQGLWVADASIFPTIPAGNINATCSAT